jgi:polyphosphate glucokinase
MNAAPELILMRSCTLPSKPARNVLVVDIGGSHIKVYARNRQEPIKIESGPAMTPRKMIDAVRTVINGWPYRAVSVGYPGPVVHGRVLRDPVNLGPGWVGFDFQKAFRRPTKVINDAAMQALGSYRGRRMLFLGLGTGLGSAMIVGGVLEPMELGHLPYKNGKTYEDYIGNAALKRRGKRKWSKSVFDIVDKLKNALQADYVVLGGGNAHRLTNLPPDSFLGKNQNALAGGVMLWQTD